MGHGQQAMHTCTCSCTRTCRLWLGPRWAARLGPVGWRGALGRRCGPAKVGDYGAHAQAGLAKNMFMGTKATDEPSTRGPGCGLLTASPAGARHMSRCVSRGVATRSILAQGLFPGPKNDAAVALEGPGRRPNSSLIPRSRCPSILVHLGTVGLAAPLPDLSTPRRRHCQH